MTPSRLIYRSTANDNLLDEKVLAALENQAASNNRGLGLHGMLILSGSQFLQVLEGPSKFVNQTYCKIVNDKRHHDINLISYEEIVKPEFIQWDMKLVNTGAFGKEIQELLFDKYPVDNHMFLFNDDAFLMAALLVDMRHLLKQN